MSEEFASSSAASDLGSFCGIGVGPGMPGLIPVAAWQFVQDADIILLPRAKSAKRSIARNCLPAHQIPEDRFRDFEFAMGSDRTLLAEHYSRQADEIGQNVCAGKRVAYLTIGDPLTYSTYIYILRALQERFPEIPCRTYPGVTSYSALAAATGFALGEGKERVLISPCPDARLELRRLIEAHDVVVLLKIGERLPMVLRLLSEMEIDDHCVFGAQVGMENEILRFGTSEMNAADASGYLSTMLIRRKPIESRHMVTATADIQEIGELELT
ncbi:MAG: precorrin-2 C(20)-methyltransferase [Verrucomicrobia bacterium]|nr:precorrin-2 C(20)-methyltransferase [Verrucomicrobiota bacterium]MBV8486500.1 precorrin-2 C(20)-methyltransferase [Verrucomicrobiota bacterium]